MVLARVKSDFVGLVGPSTEILLFIFRGVSQKLKRFVSVSTDDDIVEILFAPVSCDDEHSTFNPSYLFRR